MLRIPYKRSAPISSTPPACTSRREADGKACNNARTSQSVKPPARMLATVPMVAVDEEEVA
jgi:hypothetical protein